MSIQRRGNSWRVKVFGGDGKIIVASGTFRSLEAAKQFEAVEKAKFVIRSATRFDDVATWSDDWYADTVLEHRVSGSSHNRGGYLVSDAPLDHEYEFPDNSQFRTPDDIAISVKDWLRRERKQPSPDAVALLMEECGRRYREYKNEVLGDREKYAAMLKRAAERPKPIATPVAKPQETVADLLNRYRKEISSGKRGWKEESSKISVFLRHPIASRAVTSLTKEDFRDWQQEGVRTRKAATVNREIGIWHNAFKVAADRWGVRLPRDHNDASFNPASVVGLKPEPARDRRLTDAERECLLRVAAADSKAWRIVPIIQLNLEINFRRGELLAVRRQDINFDRRVMVLRPETTKNGAVRNVPITSRIEAILRKVIEDMPDLSLDRKLFPFGGNAISIQFRRIVDRAAKEMPSLAGFRFHDLRHETISVISKRVRSGPLLAKITGHSDQKSLQRYVNPTPEELIEMLE